jgi:TetR/AcrR family transcriptional repressor of nem operon
MRQSKAEKAKTHKRIVAIASKRFREEGLAGIGIADLMKEAGLTVGPAASTSTSNREMT